MKALAFAAFQLGMSPGRRWTLCQGDLGGSHRVNDGTKTNRRRNIRPADPGEIRAVSKEQSQEDQPLRYETNRKSEMILRRPKNVKIRKKSLHKRIKTELEREPRAIAPVTTRLRDVRNQK